ncbi:hypothetical protein P2H44_22500 [Albimonas sp. CAU 1670]|uniref:hypothetical protein n=1 Tax=Albimonas sp. CAU 1670 TaxID=3032599 RepID=UPI0023DBC9E0|nr:hypothetical protein [Albimonas sp. CAU 1670]MDF2235339.1 hypothetical protein [Albimonas sp. CAU 1670]
MPSVSRPFRAERTAAALAALLLAAGPASAEGLAPEAYDLFGEIELEGTGFLQSPQFAGQRRDDVSVAGKATFLAEWAGGDAVLRITPFARLDAADDRRTHVDLREAKLDLYRDDWSFRIGIDTVFWAKTEAVHLVDIVAQDDRIEDIDNETRLGQPMLRVGWLSELGELSLFYLPYFRERPTPGRTGRLRLNPPVADARPVYDTGAEEWTPSFAARFAGVAGDVDFGLSAFHGLGREPALFLDPGGALRPFYERITQVGLDLQYTSDATLWKFEGIHRSGQRNLSFVEESYLAATGGVEHTLYGVLDTPGDLGLIAEYAWDQRGEDALTPWQNDLFLGARLALNDVSDTSALILGSVDLGDGAVGVRLEFERRIAPNLSLGLEAQAFLGFDQSAPFDAFADDSYLRVRLTRFFGLK